MKLWYNIGIRIAALLMLIIALELIYRQYFYSEFLEEHAPLVNDQFDAISKADWLYYAASSENSYSLDDKDRSSITHILNGIQSKPVLPVVSPAHHAGLFLPLTQRLTRDDVEGIIVCMNYRSFSPEWIESHNENSLQQGAILYHNRPALFNRLMVSLNTYDPIPDGERSQRMLKLFEEWELPYPPPKNNIANWCAIEKYGDWTNPKRQLADHFIKNYAFVLDENHPRIQDFDAIANHCLKKEISLLFVILPENVELAEDLNGIELTDIMKNSARFLESRYSKPKDNQRVLNLMNHLPDSCFFDRDFPTEHYNFEGRSSIAKEVAKALNTYSK